MTAPTKIFAVGMNAARRYDLDTDGYPLVASATPYSGANIGGPITLEVTLPDATRIAHIGNNAVLQQDALPSTEPSSGILRVSRFDTATVAALQGVKAQTIGDTMLVPFRTSQQGNEPTVGMIAYAQGKDPSGNRRWITYIFPRILIYPKLKSMGREVGDYPYDLTPQIVRANLTGAELTLANNGCLSSEVLVAVSNYRKAFVAWQGDGTEDEFLFDTNLPAAVADEDNIAVYVDGVLRTANITYATTKVTFTTTMPGAGAKIVAMYDIADSAIDVD